MIIIKNGAELAAMRQACKITAAARALAGEMVRPGVTTKQIDKAVSQAKSQGKHVVCQVGGNWCRWCLMFAEFITTDEEIKALIDKNFEYIHVNYNPRKPKDETALKMLERLGNPERFGFPVLVVLDSKGNVIHTQDSSFLEEGNGYNNDKVMRFFSNWTPEAVR